MVHGMYRTTQDIVIPAGTEIIEGPTMSRYFTPHGEAVLGHGPDMTSHWRMDLEEALEAGLVERI
jgi:hypothetical protein